MGHGTEQHLEHAEHASHQAHDPFDRRVAVSMAIMAALLAGVTLASHRGHTETLRLATEAGSKHTQESDAWSFYQSKNIRSHEYQAFLSLHAMLAKDAVKHDEESLALRNFWITQVDKYEGEGYWADVQAKLKTGEKPAAKNLGELASLRSKAEELHAEATKLEEKSHSLHNHVTWIDLGHLGLELGLVFCAVAMLRKKKPFWISGLFIGLVGAGLAGYGIWGWTLLQSAGAAVTHH